MSCGFLDVSCQIQGFFSQLWWLPYVGWGLLVVVLLIALVQVKNLAGWPGVFAVLTLGAFGVGYWKGRSDKGDPLGNLLDKKDSTPAPKRPIKKRPKTLIDLFKDQ